MAGEGQFVAHWRLDGFGRAILIGLPVVLWVQTAYYMGWLAPLGFKPEVDYTEPFWNVIVTLIVIGITIAFFRVVSRHGSERVRMDAVGLHWTPPLGRARHYRWEEIDRIAPVRQIAGSKLARMMAGEGAQGPSYAVWLKTPLTGLYTALTRKTGAGDFIIDVNKSDRKPSEFIAALHDFAGDKFQPS